MPVREQRDKAWDVFGRRRARLELMVRVLGTILTAAAIVFVGVFGLATAAGAEPPLEVAEELADDGVFVARARSDVDEASLAAAIQQARFDGLRIVAVAPIDPQPSGSAYARRIQEVVDADAALVFLEDEPLETFVVEELSGGHNRARERARAVNDPGRAVLAFAEELTAEHEPSRPALIRQLMLLTLLLAGVIGAMIVLEHLVSDATAYVGRRLAARRTAAASSMYTNPVGDKQISIDDRQPDSENLVADSAHGRSDH